MPGFVDLRPVLVDDRALVLAELLADRVHLLAEEPLALLLLRALLDVVADAGPNLQLGEPLPLELEGELQPLDDVDRLEQLDALREGDVGRVRARVGERTGLADRAQELADAVVGAAQVEDLLHDGAVLALELARLDGRRVLVGRSSTSARSRPSASVWAAPMTPRWRPSSVTARMPPRMRTRSVTSATVPTAAYSLS